MRAPHRRRPDGRGARAARRRARDGAGSAYIEPGSPWQKPFVESFGSRVRDELLAVEQFSCLAEAQVMVADWRADYNERRPHSALGMRAPASFAAAWRERAEASGADRAAIAAGALLALRARSALRRHDYAAVPNPPLALTRGGPMNGVRSRQPHQQHRSGGNLHHLVRRVSPCASSRQRWHKPRRRGSDGRFPRRVTVGAASAAEFGPVGSTGVGLVSGTAGAAPVGLPSAAAGALYGGITGKKVRGIAP